MKRLFEGLYFKHQKSDHTLAFIIGNSHDHSFIQLITCDISHCFFYSPQDYHKQNGILQIGENTFSQDGIQINIEKDGFSIRGKIEYSGLTPLRYDIMGPFKYFPMQCRHTVVSLHHVLTGQIEINGQNYNFTGGTGYIEGDSGTSFPKAYTWFHCNDFAQKACVMASVANIPFAGFWFRGCIACVYFGGREYRLATYLGAKILHCQQGEIVMQQGNLRLEIAAGLQTKSHRLLAPQAGHMIREIEELAVCPAQIRFTKANEVLFEAFSPNASCENVS